MSGPPSSVLFVCSMNRVRSPVAAVVMQEVGPDMFDDQPRTLDAYRQTRPEPEAWIAGWFGPPSAAN